MGKNKSELEYGGKPQLERATALLDKFCEDVFISVSHTATLPHSHTPILADSFIGHGPMSGILSALTARPEAAWLVLACDLPLVSETTLETLLAARNPYKFATAFRSTQGDFPEPLCTVYEPKSVFPLLHFLGLGYDSPRNVLINTQVALVDQTDPTWLDNVNDPEEYEEIRRQFQS
jgi:molybdopterin-guanine dinucleotide biosynthesis protein A